MESRERNRGRKQEDSIVEPRLQKWSGKLSEKVESENNRKVERESWLEWDRKVRK